MNQSCGATRLGTESAPTSLRTFIRGPLITEGQLRLTYSGEIPFLLALGSPFLSASLPPFHRRRLSDQERYGKYLLFFNGLAKHSTEVLSRARGRIVLPLYCAASLPAPFTVSHIFLLLFHQKHNIIVLAEYKPHFFTVYLCFCRRDPPYGTDAERI